MSTVRRTLLVITVIANLFIWGCGRNLEDATLMQYTAKELNNIYSRSNKGDGEDEFARKKDAKIAEKQIKKIEKSIYYTIRTAMREEDWDMEKDELPTWEYAGSKRIALWADPKRPKSELALPSQIPWLISPYDFGLNLFEIQLPDIRTLLHRGEDQTKIMLATPWERSYGDPPPSLYLEDSGNLGGGTIFRKDWQKTHDEVLQIHTKKKQASKLVDRIKGSKQVKLKVFYQIRSRLCYIVKVEGYDNEDRLLFETNLHTEYDD